MKKVTHIHHYNANHWDEQDSCIVVSYQSTTPQNQKLGYKLVQDRKTKFEFPLTLTSELFRSNDLEKTIAKQIRDYKHTTCLIIENDHFFADQLAPIIYRNLTMLFGQEISKPQTSHKFKDVEKIIHHFDSGNDHLEIGSVLYSDRFNTHRAATFAKKDLDKKSNTHLYYLPLCEKDEKDFYRLHDNVFDQMRRWGTIDLRKVFPQILDGTMMVQTALDINKMSGKKYFNAEKVLKARSSFINDRGILARLAGI